jgi:hypothetical protein
MVLTNIKIEKYTEKDSTFWTNLGPKTKYINYVFRKHNTDKKK